MCSLPAGQLACCRWVRWPLTNNRSNRVGKIHTYRSFSVPHYAASFPGSIPPISTETHGNCETVRQTDVVQQRVCELKVEMGFRGAAMAGDHAAGRVGRGESTGWSRRTAVTAHQYRAVMSHWVPTGFPLGWDQYPSSTPPFSLNRSEDKSFALVVFSFVSVGFGWYSWHALLKSLFNFFCHVPIFHLSCWFLDCC